MPAWSDLVEAMKTVGEMKQLVICEPHMAAQVDALIQRSGMAHLWRAEGSARCPKGKLILVRDQPDLIPPDGMLF